MSASWLCMGALALVAGWACVTGAIEAWTLRANARALDRLVASYRGRP